jgi:hypothetical protein
MSGHCPKCGDYTEEDEYRLCSRCAASRANPTPDIQDARTTMSDKQKCGYAQEAGITAPPSTSDHMTIEQAEKSAHDRFGDYCPSCAAHHSVVSTAYNHELTLLREVASAAEAIKNCNSMLAMQTEWDRLHIALGKWKNLAEGARP